MASWVGCSIRHGMDAVAPVGLGACSFATCPVVQTIRFGASACSNALIGVPVRDGILAAFNEYSADPSAITVRGSYFDKAATIVNYFVSLARERIAVFGQSSSFGITSRDGVVAAMDSWNLYLHSEGYYTKNMATSYWQQEIALVLKNMSASTTSSLPPNAIVIVATHEPASILIQQMHALWPDTIVVCISSFVPDPLSTTSKLAQKFRAAADKMIISKADHLALEGCLMARLVIAVFQLLPDLNFTQQAFLDALYSECYFNIDGFRLGPFCPDDMDGGCNQGIQGSHVVKIYPNQTLADVFDFAFSSCGYQARDWKRLTFGQSCSFSGDAAQFSRCTAFRDGILAAFKQVNDPGGIRGTRRLYLETLDDAGDAKLALLYNYKFLNDPEVFGLVGSSSLGIADTVKLLAKATDKVVFGAYSGDTSLRDPFQPNINNFRASGHDELALTVHVSWSNLSVV